MNSKAKRIKEFIEYATIKELLSIPKEFIDKCRKNEQELYDILSELERMAKIGQDTINTKED